MSCSLSNPNADLSIMPALKKIMAEAKISGEDLKEKINSLITPLSEEDLIKARKEKDKKDREQIEYYKAIAKAELV